MAYDEGLEKRIDEVLGEWGLQLAKKKMFGGIGYLVQGNMCFGISRDKLLVRSDEAGAKAMLQRTNTEPFQMGKMPPSTTWVLAGGEAIASSEKLSELMAIGRDYALSLPPK